MKCAHLTPHEYPARTSDPHEKLFREFLDVNGWTSGGGYCYAYFPEWLYLPFETWLRKRA